MATVDKLKKLQAENDELRMRLGEAEETLRAIRSGEVDALVVSGPEGGQIFTLEGAEHPYRVLVESMNEGAATLAADGTILYCNSSLAAMLRMPLEKIIGTPFSSLVAPADCQVFADLLVKCLAKKCKGKIALTNGEEGYAMPVQLSCNALEVAGSRGASIVISDLTEVTVHQLELEAQLHELLETRLELEISRDRYESLYDYAPLGYVTLDEKGVIREINLAGARMLGREPSLLIGTPFITQITKVDRKKILNHLTVCKRGKSKVVSSLTLFTERGKTLHLQVHTLPVHDPLLNQTFYRTALIDMGEVAEIKSLLEELTLADEKKRRFIATELDEQIGWHVAAADGKLDWLARTVQSADQLAALADIRELLDICSGRIRSLVGQICPPVPHDGQSGTSATEPRGNSRENPIKGDHQSFQDSTRKDDKKHTGR
jgi:PAS domain S-box-containing protein